MSLPDFLTRCRLLKVCGENKRRGEGVLDLRFESSQELLSAGYDTYIRLWDIRSPRYE